MESLLELFEELSRVCRESRSFERGIPRNGDIEEIGFCFDAPSKGRLPFYIIRNNKQYLLGHLCDCYPFTSLLRGWMERAITPTIIGRRRNEGITIECEDGVIELTLSPTNLESSIAVSKTGKYFVAGILKIKHVNNHDATHECFCDVERTVYNLYCSLQNAFRKYGSSFDDRNDWLLLDREMPFRIDKRTSLLLQEQLHSDKIELLGRLLHE